MSGQDPSNRDPSGSPSWLKDGQASSDPDEGRPSPAAETVAHLQGAAREMIAATRGFLDVAEEVLDDPESIEKIVDSLASIGRMVSDRAARPGSGPSADVDPPSGGVEHIDVD